MLSSEEEGLDFRPYFVACPAERLKALFLQATHISRVVDAPVQSPARAVEYRAFLLCSVTDGNDVIELLVDELIKGFRHVVGNVNL